ncbi:MAG: hypothetical protein U9Q67_01880 [Patescibacteria group bacterium]|nr:hypothetical protein [Patescibacteria group bacterium]
MGERVCVNEQGVSLIDPEYWRDRVDQKVDIRFDNTVITMVVGEVIEVNESHFYYHIVTLTLDIPLGLDVDEWRNVDANLWILPPAQDDEMNSATRVQRIVDSEALGIAGIIQGCGNFVTVGSSSEAIAIPLNCRDKFVPVYLSQGDVVSLVSDPQGMVVLGINYPVFSPLIEVELTPDGVNDTEYQDQALKNPAKFWALFNQLRACD